MPNPPYTYSRKSSSRTADGIGLKTHLDKPLSNTNPNTPTRITIPSSSVYNDPRRPSPADPLPVPVPSSEFERVPTAYTHSSSNSRSRSLSHSQEIGESSLEESYVPPAPAGDDALDNLWETLRHKKELKMAKEKPKVQSLQESQQLPEADNEEFSPIEAPELDVPVAAHAGLSRSDHGQLRRQKSITSFRESPDGRIIAAFIDMRGVQKQDVHVSYQRNRLIISWQSIDLYEYEEDGRVIREKAIRDYQRVHPLPEGTRFEEISGVMNGKYLVLRYPNSRSFRVENRPSSVVS